MNTDTSSHPQGSNPIAAIGMAIALALGMVIVTFAIFINSNAYVTVRQIQVGTKFAKSIKMDGYDTNSSIKASDITKYEQALGQRLDAIDDSADFEPGLVSDNALGLD